MDRDTYLGHVGSDGRRLIEAARAAPTAVIPSCPDWDMRALVGHVASVHAWVTNILSTRAETRPHLRRVDELEGDFDAIASEYDENLARLLDALSATADDELVWNWFDRQPARAAFWFRRMAQETVVHRLDAELGAQRPSPIDAALAVDGIDEFLGIVQRFIGGEPIEGFEGSIAFVTTDVVGTWCLSLAPDRIEFVDVDPEATVRGSASDVYRFVVHRGANDLDLEVLGDRRVVDRWNSVTFE